MFRELLKLPMPELEEKILKFWETNGIFEKSLKKTRKGTPFTFYDGPPFATGLPHYGHILASTIKDVIPRYQTMKGRFVRRRWGWDCHGLPIEEVVERHLGVSGKKQIEEIGVEKFNETCRSKVLEFADEWGKMVRRIARWVDFDNSYKTMDRTYMESVWWAFKKIYDRGLVYEGRKVLMYCPRCETPVSNFEVAMDNSYQDVVDETVTVKFHLLPNQKFGSYETRDKVYILAWTTTPWTLPGNVALAVGEDILYSAVRIDGIKELLILATERVGEVLKGHTVEIVHERIKGKDLVGLSYEPLFEVQAAKSDKAFKVYPADFVSTEEGTGVVHTAVVYGEEDYELGQKIGLPVVPLLDSKGMFNAEAPKFLRGRYFKDADALVIADLGKRGLLFKKEKQTHSYPHCWRCGTALFYNAIPAWFINVQKIKKDLIRSNEKEINWYPEHLKRGRYKNSVEQAPDWNISRNRYWGNPIPVWKCGKCGKVHIVGSSEELEGLQEKSTNRYLLMRHGLAESNITNAVSHWPERIKYHLTLGGRVQVEKLLRRWRWGKVHYIYASDLIRTKETEQMLAEAFKGERVVFDPRLREIDTGAFEGKSPAEYHTHFSSDLEKFTKRLLGVETLADVRGRMYEFVREMEQKHKGKTIVVVSHDYPLWMLESAMRGWTDEEAVAAKHARGGDFYRNGEMREVAFRRVPRDETGRMDLHRPYIDKILLTCSRCGGCASRIEEIFDSWMEAASMPFAEYHYPFENKKIFESRSPAQFVAEYIPQTRAWFYVMHVVSLILFNHAPFENVVTTGTILAEDGSKMSKSKNNFPDPWKVIDKYGVDALRFYLMSSPVMQADDLDFSVKGVENIYRKNILILRNVYNYFELYAREAGWRASLAPKSDPSILDRWIRVRTNELINTVTEYLDSYDTVRATKTVEEYINDLSTWYLRRSRGRKDSAFFATFHDSLLKTSQVIAPIMPYLSEVLYSNLTHSFGAGSDSPESVHLTDWPKAGKLNADDESLLKEMTEVRRLASLALAAREVAGIRVRQPIAKLKLKTENLKLKTETGLLDILKDEVNVKKIVFDKNIKNEVELDIVLTHELLEEGWLRDLTRVVQDLRQDAGCVPRDAIRLFAEVPSELRHVMEKYGAEFRRAVNAKTIEYKKPTRFDAEIETRVGEWQVWFAITKQPRL
ncbi:MAG: class I tRNA ligase family protein [Candidatus Jorgensenbacteria bacterium]